MSDSPQEILETLQGSILFEPDFPKRRQVTLSEYLALSEQEKLQLLTANSKTQVHADDQCSELCHLVEALGRAKYQPAVPLLSQIWNECVLEPVRSQAGHALFAIGTKDAFSALAALLDDRDDFSRHMAVNSIFTSDPTHAFDVLERRFSSSAAADVVVAVKALEILSPSGFLGDGSAFWAAAATYPLLKDQRWLEKCAELRHHETFGAAAREVLRYAPHNRRTAALSRIRSVEPTVGTSTTPRIRRDGRLLERYRSGEHLEVWQDIRKHTVIEGDFREEVIEVALETMVRVRDNTAKLSERLIAEGWRPYVPLGAMHSPPAKENDKIIQSITEITESPAPPTLLAFWNVVGSINWVWDYDSEEKAPDFGLNITMDQMDPLCIAAPKDIQYLFDEWHQQKHELHPDLGEPYAIELAPDVFHKANTSGGPAYSVSLPFHGADPIFENEPNNLPFLDYLRLCFRWTGFPGLKNHAEHSAVGEFVSKMTRDLSPF